MRQLIPIAIIFLSLLCSCAGAGSDSQYTIAFKDRTGIDKFPLSEKCDSGRILDFKTLGNMEIKVIDSLAVISTATETDSWKVISLKTDSVIGHFATMGGGPDEFSMIPLLSQASVFRKGGELILSVPDNMAKRRHDIRLSELTSGSAAYDSVTEDPDLDNLTLYKGIFDNDIKFSIRVFPEEGRIQRGASVGSDTVSTAGIALLNQYRVGTPDKLGLLMPTVAVSPSLFKVAEVYNNYPQINLYSLSDNWAKTVIPGGEPADYGEYLTSDTKKPDLIYRSVKGFDNFFVVNKVGDNNSSELLFFDWDGNPVASLLVPSEFNSFDIDFINRRLLTINFTDDVIMQYPISNFLDKL